jgi:hypothetical protein
VRREDARSGADRCGKDRDVLRISELPRPVSVMRGRAVDQNWGRADELLEERRGLGELSGQVSANFSHGGLGEHQTKEAQLPENQDRVAGARAGQQSGDQDISIDANG